MGNSSSSKHQRRSSSTYQQGRRSMAATTTSTQSGPRPIAGRPSDATSQIIPDQFTSLGQVTAGESVCTAFLTTKCAHRFN